jgi:hypothetical protein
MAYKPERNAIGHTHTRTGNEHVRATGILECESCRKPRTVRIRPECVGCHGVLADREGRPPYEFNPNVYTCPSSARATVCESPHATKTIPVDKGSLEPGPMTSVGIKTVSSVLSTCRGWTEFTGAAGKRLGGYQRGMSLVANHELCHHTDDVTQHETDAPERHAIGSHARHSDKASKCVPLNPILECQCVAENGR